MASKSVLVTCKNGAGRLVPALFTKMSRIAMPLMALVRAARSVTSKATAMAQGAQALGDRFDLGQGAGSQGDRGTGLSANLGNGAPMPRPAPMIYALLPAREKFGSWPRLSANQVALARFRGRQ